MFDLTVKEQKIFQKLSTPAKIQDWLDELPINHEKYGPTQWSPRRVLREKKAHCIEGALLAATALWYHGEEPLILDLRTLHYDDDHVVTLFRRQGCWGAISKTNHAVLRYRDPIYRSVRELALSYFHEYFMLTNGRKTLREYSRPFNLKRSGTTWITREDDLWDIAETLNNSHHYPLIPKKHERLLRSASLFERKISGVSEWPKNSPHT